MKIGRGSMWAGNPANFKILVVEECKIRYLTKLPKDIFLPRLCFLKSKFNFKGLEILKFQWRYQDKFNCCTINQLSHKRRASELLQGKTKRRLGQPTITKELLITTLRIEVELDDS